MNRVLPVLVGVLRHFFAKAKDTATQLEPLPPELRSRWQAHCGALPAPDLYRETVSNAVSELLAAWHHDTRQTCGVITAAPTEPLATLITEALPAGWQILNSIPAIAPKGLVVIPDLALLFERSIVGLERLEHLAQLISDSQQTLWLIGCNSWLWHYLQITLHFDVVASRLSALPSLPATDLRTWLENNEELPPASDDFYDSLQSAAQGNATVAAALWLNTLRLAANSEDVCLGTVAYPELPQKDDRESFCLYSFLLHQTLNDLELAAALQCDRYSARALIRAFVEAGVLERMQAARYRLAAAHYPKLRSLLASNNFSVPEV